MEILYFIIIICFVFFTIQEKDIYENKKKIIDLNNLNKKYENEIYNLNQNIIKLNNNYENEINIIKQKNIKDILKLKQKIIIYENKHILPPS